MALGICFTAEKRRVYQDQWSFLFSNFGVQDIWEIGQAEKIYQPTTKIEDASGLPSDRPLVVVQPEKGRYVQGSMPLATFVHPDDAIYMFGGSHENFTTDMLGGRDADAVVYIPFAKHECYAFAAAYIVLWDRYSKRGSHG